MRCLPRDVDPEAGPASAGALDGAMRREVLPGPRCWRSCFWTTEGQEAWVEMQKASAREHGRPSPSIDEWTLRGPRWSGGLRQGCTPRSEAQLIRQTLTALVKAVW
ncbi:hypothetical protein NDU88_005675 [Pleurodeles waltl]|uniref:Uncharacterized protein n=1 Tax=Pleurodeles waltl TaxID=8319 RepID=A0AAV7ULR6_PLEWA|nr:hypothetical protein NDU88_005675 [Pleurodeles waltl]